MLINLLRSKAIFCFNTNFKINKISIIKKYGAVIKKGEVSNKKMNPSKDDDQSKRNDAQGGEGNVDADRNYRESTREFVNSGRVEQAAENAATMSDEELEEARKAEQKGKAKAKS